MNLYEIDTPEKARAAAERLYPRRTLTFQAFGEALLMRPEDLRGAHVTLGAEDATFEVTGVEDQWSVENGLKRLCTAVEKFPSDNLKYSEMDEPK